MYFGSSEAQAGTPRRRRERQRQTLRAYLPVLLQHPNRALSDIAFERPWPRGLALLAGGFALSGVALGATGLPGVDRSVTGLPEGALLMLLVGAAAFLIITLAFHGVALILEGEGAFMEFVSAMSFAMLPVYVVTPVAVLRLLPGGWGGFTFFMGCFAVALWTLRLSFLAIREGHRFSGLQAGLTISGTLLAALLGLTVLFFVSGAYVLVSS